MKLLVINVTCETDSLERCSQRCERQHHLTEPLIAEYVQMLENVHIHKWLLQYDENEANQTRQHWKLSQSDSIDVSAP